MPLDVIAVSLCLMACCSGLPSSPRTPFGGYKPVSSDETTPQSAAERPIWRRDKSRPDLEVDTPQMLAAIIWLALLEIRTGTRRCPDIDLVGVTALTLDFVEWAQCRKADVYLSFSARRVRGSSIE